MPTPEEIEAVLKFDPLAEAERITGKSYKDNLGVAMMGLLRNNAGRNE